MEVRIETTRGLGKQAEVWVDGNLLTVCDGISSRNRRCEVGPLEKVKFSYVTEEGISLESTFADNPAKRKYLDHVRGWSYVGYGQIVSIVPVVINFGLLQMEDSHWVTNDELIGRYVRIPIDRLEINPASQPDFP